ncbi:hypothetical protein C2142_37100 [Streptomyces sp. CB01881]|nr:hypothetical protein C2142_37100 [Streptomyces sp. CB01881]
MVEVAAAIARLAGGPQPLTPALQGVAAYEWAAGRRPVAPVSGALLVGDLPSDDQLQGEERAALRRVHNRRISARRTATSGSEWSAHWPG